jgi:hypothetical protein
LVNWKYFPAPTWEDEDLLEDAAIQKYNDGGKPTPNKKRKLGKEAKEGSKADLKKLKDITISGDSNKLNKLTLTLDDEQVEFSFDDISDRFPGEVITYLKQELNDARK